MASLLDTWSVEFKGVVSDIQHGRLVIRADTMAKALERFTALMPSNVEATSIEKN